MDLKTVLFLVFAAILVIAALRVITARNPVHAVLFLVLSFFTASMIWVLLRAEFLAIALVLVYVGAVMVLFLFVVMMLDINLDKIREGFTAYLPLGLTIGAVMALEMSFVLFKVFLVADAAVPALPANYSNTKEIGKVLYTEYAFPFEIAALVLLVAIVAAIALTLRHRKDVKWQDPSRQVKVKASDRVRLVDITVPSERRGAAPASDTAPTAGGQ